MLPDEIINRPQLNRRLGIKSSIPEPQKAFAALYIIWRGLGCPAEIPDYSDPVSDNTATLQIRPETYDAIRTYWSNVGTVPADLKDKLEGTALFSAQLEHLQVLFGIFWKIAKISFVDLARLESSERTGGKRFLKKIELTSNMDVADLIIAHSGTEYPDQECLQLLLGWLSGTVQDSVLSRNLRKYLSILSEDTQFRHDDLQFLQEGIYSAISANGGPVSFVGEAKGPLRILSSVISCDLHPLLTKRAGNISFRDGLADVDRNYIKRVSNYLDVTAVNENAAVQGAQEALSEQDDDTIPLLDSETEFPRNMILYGAPGTGKSFTLKNRISRLNPQGYMRVTFYSDYSYSQFVGGYKPVPVYISNDENIRVMVRDRLSNDLLRPGQPVIEYSFTEGPLLDLYVKAKNNPEQKYLLIIEELNRADAAAVFGDFFQLLDRDDSGESAYSIRMSGDAHQFLADSGIDDLEIKLPKNLYIWATLNSADQGVFPVDTAFKRRWSFEYLPLNKHQLVVADLSIPLKRGDGSADLVPISWNSLRNSINAQLESLGIQEDLMIGPFFLRKDEMQDDTAFKYKLLAYLRDDILRHQHGDFFKVHGPLHKIIDEYDAGRKIFNFDLVE